MGSAWKQLTLDLFPEFQGKRLAGFATWQVSDSNFEAIKSLQIQILEYLTQQLNITDLTWVNRPESGSPTCEVLLGSGEPLISYETLGEQKLLCEIQLQNVFHPGLFLDHRPLRQTLLHLAESKKVLNLFAYTGCLSVAAGLGIASEVTTLDLSKKTLEWAKRNWELNVSAGTISKSLTNRLIADDAQIFLARKHRQLKKAEHHHSLMDDLRYDLILLDPPSFSRSKSGVFQVKKNLRHLIQLCIGLISPGGALVVSINTDDLSQAWLQSEFSEACENKKKFKKIELIEIPIEFGDKSTSHLKGVIASGLE